MTPDDNVYAPPAAKLESDQKACQQCGASIHLLAEVCPRCGVRQRPPVSKIALLLLAFFGGGLGLHKFYLRKPVQGILYALFCWTLIPGLIALIEFIIYACTDESALNRKYTATSAILVAAIGFGVFFVLWFVVGILAAIAIPAYQDYGRRAKIEMAMAQVEPLRMKVMERIADTGALPATAADVPDATAVTVPAIAVAQLTDHGVIVIRFDEALRPPIAGTTLEFTPSLDGGQLHWQCLGNLPARYLPRRCRAL